MNEESVIAYLKSECSPGERDELENWISQSAGNRKRFEEIKRIWELSRADYSGLPADPEGSWKRIHRAINGESLRIEPVRRTSIGRFWRIAASVALLVGLGYVTLKYSGKGNPAVEQAVMQTQAGITEVELPDGSRVWLNAHSMLTYPSSFSRKERSVSLEGEAYFEVNRERRRTFTVGIGDSRVTVLGTSFNILSPGREKEQVVTVATGKVSFHPQGDPSGGVLLAAGERGVCSPYGRSYRKSMNEDRNFLAWKTGVLTFRGTALEEVCRVLSAHYGQEISLSDSVDTNRQLTVTWDNKEPEEVLEILTMTLDLSYRTEGETIIIYELNPPDHALPH
jgi:transmembrane sensor